MLALQEDEAAQRGCVVVGVVIARDGAGRQISARVCQDVLRWSMCVCVCVCVCVCSGREGHGNAAPQC